MASSYPNSLDSLPTSHQDGVQEVIHATDINNLADAVNKIEAELGTTPKGSAASVAARITALERVPIQFKAGTTYTLALADAGTVVAMTSTSAITVTIPPNSSVAFPIGTQILFRQGNPGGVITIAPGTGVTLESRGSIFTTAGNAAWATLIQINTNLWDLFGDLA